MSSNKDKAGNDIDALVEHLHLGSVRYREFGTTRSAVIQAVAPRTVPAAPVPAPAPVVSPIAGDEDSKSLRAVTGGSPLAFAFERLRRQAIGSTQRKPELVLNLPERHAYRAGAPMVARQRLLKTIFAELETPSQSRAHRQA